MKWMIWIMELGLGLALAAGNAMAQGPGWYPRGSSCCPPGAPVSPSYIETIPTFPGQTMPGQTTQPGQQAQPAQPGQQGQAAPGAQDTTQPTTPGSDAFGQAPEAGTQAAASYNPNVFGDLIGSQVN